MIVVIDVGCLECSTASDLLGVYDTLDEAREAHPGLRLRADLDDGRAYGDWHGESMTVAFDTDTDVVEREPVVPGPPQPVAPPWTPGLQAVLRQHTWEPLGGYTYGPTDPAVAERAPEWGATRGQPPRLEVLDCPAGVRGITVWVGGQLAMEWRLGAVTAEGDTLSLPVVIS